VGNEWLQMFSEFEIFTYGSILLAVALLLPGGIVSLVPIIAAKFKKRTPAIGDSGL
jgi:hypothetical protein